MATRLNWHKDAECIGVAAEVFFPSHGDYEKARRICAQCKVRQECLDECMERDLDNYGMFGGLTPAERYEFRYGKVPIRVR